MSGGQRWIQHGVLVVFAVGAIVPIGASAASSDESAQAASRKSRAIKRVTRRLANKSFTRFTSSGMSSFDQRLHLCRNKHFIYDTVSSSEGGGGDVQRVEGRWRVVSARITRRGWRARVRGRPDDGSRAVTVRIRKKGRRYTIDGNVVFVERSDLC
jgi:hypothetical protein